LRAEKEQFRLSSAGWNTSVFVLVEKAQSWNGSASGSAEDKAEVADSNRSGDSQVAGSAGFDIAVDEQRLCWTGTTDANISIGF
jgi:hypothetical protein